MKKNFTLIASILCTLLTGARAQLNYNFTAASATYQPLLNGITPTLVNRPYGYNQYSYDYDEGFANNLPIGFVFNYNGTNYTTINVNANGFATLGGPMLTDSNYIENYYTNNLTYGDVFGEYGATTTLPSFGYPYAKSKPFLAPLWDDLNLGMADGNLKYLTQGTQGKRVFTLEWSNIYWQYDATSPVLSVELKLYEGSNIIEFCYKDLGGTPSPEASASIGITDSYNNGTILSLQDVSSNPVVSNIENSNISQKPADDQVYRFTPSQYPAPLSLQYSAYTNSSVVFKWAAAPGASGYQYAVNNSSTPPVSGTATSSAFATVSSLTPSTNYFIFVRSVFAGNQFSAWSSVYFQSASGPASLPYSENFESSNVPLIPANSRAQTIDSLNFSPGWGTGIISYDIPAGTYNDGYADHGSNYLNLNANLDTVPTIFYTPGLALNAGVTYKLNFNFAPGYWNMANEIEDTGLNHLDMLTVTAGTAVGLDSASQTIVTLPWRSLDFSKEDAAGYIDTTVFFTAARTGVYYIGFSFESGVQVDIAGHTQINASYASLDDISITASTLPVTLLHFTGEAQGKANILHWVTATEENNTGFEIQRSSDGFNFDKIAFANSKAFNGTSTVKLTYSYADAAFTPGANFYRLKQVDKNNNFTYSNIILLKNTDDSAAAAPLIYPNPANDVINIKLAAGTNNNKYILRISDMQGRQLLNKTTSLGTGETHLQVSVAHLPAGVYLLTLVSANGETTVKKFVKQ